MHETTLVGTIFIPIIIGLKTEMTPFYVIDKALGYNMLLGRPCIHRMHMIPSTLFRQIQFIRVYVLLADPNPFTLC